MDVLIMQRDEILVTSCSRCQSNYQVDINNGKIVDSGCPVDGCK